MLHEVLLALSGYPGSFFVENDNRIQVTESIDFLQDSERTLLNRILRIATEYKALKNFIDYQNDLFYATLTDEYNPNGTEHQCPGRYLQAFCNGLEEVLMPYNQTLLDLEMEILNDPYLSLTHIRSRVENHEWLLNMMNSLIKEVKRYNVRGCYLLEFLHRHSISGAEEVQKAMNCILKSCHAVFYSQLSSWLLYGQLIDSYSEFIIYHKTDIESSMTSSSPDSDASPGTALDDKQQFVFSQNKKNQLPPSEYAIRLDMLPSYIPLSVAQKILYIGNKILLGGNDPREHPGAQIPLRKNEKSIFGEKEAYFIKKLLHLQKLDTFSLVKLEEVVDEIKLCVSEHLWTLAMEDAQLDVQLRLMKDFFLLGRGELFQEFICQADPILIGPPVSSTCKDINLCFTVAAAKILMEDDPSIEKFHFILVDSPHGITTGKSNTENGWSRLALTYQPSWPLVILFTPQVLQNYNTLFCFLLRVKKTQMDLHNVWRGHKQLKSKFDTVVMSLMNSLMFVINNLQYYLQVDVLECQYSILQNELQNTRDFETIWRAHSFFQSNIMSQTFLFMNSDPCSRDGNLEAESPKVDNPVHNCLSQLLSLAESFCLQNQVATLKSEEEVGVESDKDWAQKMTSELDRLVVFLMQLLSGLRSHPSGSHLSQLLLRLDYNCWFSEPKRLRLNAFTQLNLGC